MGKKITIVIIILLVLGVGFFMYNKSKKVVQAPVSPSATSTQSFDPNDQEVEVDETSPDSGSATPPANQKPNGQYSSGGETNGSDIQVVEVDFDGTKFSPATVTVHQNDYVFFKNTSANVNVWPASDPHPTHTDYPGFDANKPITPGQQYKFQFTKIGTWGYHNHLNPKITGTVVVTK